MSARLAAAGVALLAVLSVTSLALDAPAAVRVLPMLGVLVALPGFAVTRHLRADSRLTAVPLGAAAGIAWLVIASEVLVYGRWWRPAALIPATVCVSAVIVAIPVQRARHALHWNGLRRATSALCVLATASFIALQTASLYLRPYSAAELDPLRFAFVTASDARRGAATPKDSILARLEAWMIPFRHPTVGTLLAARWLTLGAVALTVGLAGMWARSSTDRRGRVASWAIVIAAAAAVHTEQLRPGSVVAAPLLMAAGWCLAPSKHGAARPAVGGLLLGAAALGSRTGAAAAAALAVWAIIEARWVHHPTTFPTWAGPIRRMLAGAGVALAAGAVIAVVGGMPILALSDTAVSGRSALLALVAVLLAGSVVRTLLLSGSQRWQQSNSSWLLRGARRNAPSVALAGACLGALLEPRPVLGDVMIPLLLLAVATARVVWPDGQRISAGTRRDADAQKSSWQLGLTVMIVGVAVVGRFVDLHGVGNHAQVARMAYVLEHTGPQDAVFDPSHTFDVLRVGSSRADLDEAAFAIVPPSMLTNDPRLRDALRSRFEATPYPDIWRATFEWSEPSLTFEAPFVAKTVR